MIRQQIKEQLKLSPMSSKEMAEKINCSPAALSSYFSRRNELNFYSLFELVRTLYPSNQNEMMNTVCMDVEKPENVKCAVEYASFNANKDLLGDLIKQHENTKNRGLAEWVNVYTIHLDYLNNKLTVDELANKSRYIASKQDNLNVFIKWMEVYAHYINDNFSILSYLINELKDEMENIDDEFLKHTFLSRLNIIFGNFLIFNNKPEQARECYQIVIDQNMSLQKVGNAYHGMALTHMFKGKETAKEHFVKSYEYLSKTNHTSAINNLKDSMNLFYNYHGETDYFEMYDQSLYNQLESTHNLIKSGDKKQAIEILHRIDEKSLKPLYKAFYNYYIGLASNNNDALYKAVMNFRQRNNYFFAILPARELLNRGESKFAVFAAYGSEF